MLCFLTFWAAYQRRGFDREALGLLLEVFRVGDATGYPELCTVERRKDDAPSREIFGGFVGVSTVVAAVESVFDDEDTDTFWAQPFRVTVAVVHRLRWSDGETRSSTSSSIGIGLVTNVWDAGWPVVKNEDVAESICVLSLWKPRSSGIVPVESRLRFNPPAKGRSRSASYMIFIEVVIS